MLKNLSNCSPREFLVQTNKIRILAKDFIDETDIFNIKTKWITQEVKDADNKNKENIIKKNIINSFDEILANLLEKNVDKTTALLCYCCFVEPENESKYEMADLLESIGLMCTDKRVIGFFTTLIKSLPTNTSKVAKE